MSNSRRRARLVLIATALIFFLPVLAAWILNVAAPGWRPFGQVNHGALLQPPPRLPDTPLRGAGGARVEPPHLAGKWSLVYLLHGPCASECEQALDTMRRARLALAREAPRVHRLLLIRPPGIRYAPATRYDDLDSAIASETWLSVLEEARPEADGAAGNIYVVDPQGFLIMRHPGDTPVRHLHEDLDRLLDVSKIG